MGLISRVSSRTYRELKWLHIKVSRSRRCWRKPASKTDLCHMVSVQDRQQNPVQRQTTTLETNQARTLNQKIFSKFCKLESCCSTVCSIVIFFLNISTKFIR